MLRVLSPLIAVLSLSWVGSATAATIVFQQSGHTATLDLGPVDLAGPGTYEFSFSSSIPLFYDISASYENHWDIFVAPPPRPHDEFIEGNESTVEDGTGGFATGFSWQFVVPKATYLFFPAGGYADQGIPDGTPLYEITRAEGPYFNFYADFEGLEFDYALTVEHLSAVPEPSAWAMMIAGFGMVGAIMRRGSRGRAQAAAVVLNSPSAMGQVLRSAGCGR